jgi:hypothetical protein
MRGRRKEGNGKKLLGPQGQSGQYFCERLFETKLSKKVAFYKIVLCKTIYCWKVADDSSNCASTLLKYKLNFSIKVK